MAPEPLSPDSAAMKAGAQLVEAVAAYRSIDKTMTVLVPTRKTLLAQAVNLGGHLYAFKEALHLVEMTPAKEALFHVRDDALEAKKECGFEPSAAAMKECALALQYYQAQRKDAQIRKKDADDRKTKRAATTGRKLPKKKVNSAPTVEDGEDDEDGVSIIPAPTVDANSMDVDDDGAAGAPSKHSLTRGQSGYSAVSVVPNGWRQERSPGNVIGHPGTIHAACLGVRKRSLLVTSSSGRGVASSYEVACVSLLHPDVSRTHLAEGIQYIHKGGASSLPIGMTESNIAGTNPSTSSPSLDQKKEFKVGRWRCSKQGTSKGGVHVRGDSGDGPRCRILKVFVMKEPEHVFRRCGDNGNIRITSRISYAMMAPVTISIILPALWFRGNNLSPQYKFEYNAQMSLVQLLYHPPDQPGSHFGSDVITFGDAAQDIQIFDMHYPKAHRGEGIFSAYFRNISASSKNRMTSERLDDESGKLMAEFPWSSTNQKCARGLCVPAGRLIFDYMRNLVEASRMPEAYAYMPG
ncbi:hypothetical protein FB45DRAFT_870838 [Roridomyces roridus]|uniref:Uncharacterized protein n=1 Tax=Roridomyces roridus TaxID=1738132 RepID=A0AAD7FHX6_9AGAR|nr:hypothetical protein FB45DRAFT_870838 [Roridomyces roridus]